MEGWETAPSNGQVLVHVVGARRQAPAHSLSLQGAALTPTRASRAVHPQGEPLHRIGERRRAGPNSDVSTVSLRGDDMAR